MSKNKRIEDLIHEVSVHKRAIQSQREHIQSLTDQAKVTSSRARSYARKVSQAYLALTDADKPREYKVEDAINALTEFHPVNDNGLVLVPSGPVILARPPVSERPVVKEGRGGKNPAPTQETSVPEPRVELYPVYPPVGAGNPTWVGNPADQPKGHCKCGCSVAARIERS